MDSRTSNFLRHVGQTSPSPIQLEIEYCSGVFYHTTDGNKYYDFTSGIAVSNIGHQHPKLVESIQRQASRHLHTMVYGEFVEQPQVDYAKQLTGLLPDSLNCVYYCTSGGEAVEAALKLAKRKTGRSELISCTGSYHGSTHGALSIMGNEYYKTAYRPLLPDTKLIGYNDFEDLNQISTNTACVVVEPVQAASGVRVANPDWLGALRKKCDEVGCLLIFDEIQTGFGRTGKLFSFQHTGVIPDLLLIAKAMGGGVPIGALVGHHDLLNLFTNNPILGHINTFGGNALAVSAAQAVLEVLTSEPDLIEQVSAKANKIYEALKDFQAVEQITYQGLLMAIHFETKEKTKQFFIECIESGIVLMGFLFNEQAVRIAPPLTITTEELDDALGKMQDILARM